MLVVRGGVDDLGRNSSLGLKIRFLSTWAKLFPLEGAIWLCNLTEKVLMTNGERGDHSQAGETECDKTIDAFLIISLPMMKSMKCGDLSHYLDEYQE